MDKALSDYAEVFAKRVGAGSVTLSDAKLQWKLPKRDVEDDVHYFLEANCLRAAQGQSLLTREHN